MLIVLFIIAIILLVIDWLMIKPFTWKKKGIPYSIPLPVFGNAIAQFCSSYRDYWNEQYNKVKDIGGMFGFHHFRHQALVVTDPVLINEILINQSETFCARGMYCNPKRDPYATNLFNLSCEDWKFVRNKLSPFFSPMRLKTITNIMSVNMKDYVNAFDMAANSKKPVDVHELSLKLATDVVVNAFFGIKGECMTNPNSYFNSIHKYVFTHAYILKVLVGNISTFLYDFLRLTLLPNHVVTTLTRFVEDVFDQRSKGIGVRKDFVQGMYELVKKDSSLQSNERAFTKIEAAAQCMVMYTAGTESTGNTLCYALNELAVNQEIQEKVRQEINHIISTTGSSEFTYDILNELKYTKMVIYETLRKYPLLPVITRMSSKATRLQGIDVDKETMVFIPVVGLHRDPKYYPEPEKFLPERFKTDDNKEIFLSFGVGPRTCIGWKVSVIEMANALYDVLPKYRILPSDSTTDQIVFSWQPVLNPKNGIWLNVEKI